MRILYSITKSEIGGAQVHVAELAKHMKAEGHAVAIMAFPGGWLENEATKLGVRFYPNVYFANSFNPFNLMRAKVSIKKTIEDFKPDLVHAHSSFAGILTRQVVRGRIKTIFTAHSWAFTDGASIFRKIVASISERRVSKWTDKIICVSDYDRRLALRYNIAEEMKLVTIYNGVPDNTFIGAPKDNALIANGRLAYPKEYLLLLEAYKIANIDLRLKIISDGPDRQKIDSKISELGLNGKIELLGDLPREAVQEKLSKSKAFVLISKHEGFPLSILEAMAAGLPVVASKVGGIPEEIDGSCGILVQNETSEIANALKKVSNESASRQMGEAARMRFEENFTLEKFLNETQKVYEEIAGS